MRGTAVDSCAPQTVEIRLIEKQTNPIILVLQDNLEHQKLKRKINFNRIHLVVFSCIHLHHLLFSSTD